MAKLRVGDRVKIVRYSHDTNGKIGWITRIDGGYIYVRLRWLPPDREIEVYDCEIEYWPKGE
jgi:hypothetical protein